MNWAWRQALKPTAKLILMALADAADDNGLCWPSVSVVAFKCNVSTRTVRRVMQQLVVRGLLITEPRYRKDGSCSSNRYRLLMAGGDNLSPPLVSRDSTPGPACQGDPDMAVIPGTTIGTEKEPPLPRDADTTPEDRGGGVRHDLEYPKDLLPAERTEAEVMIESLGAPRNQQVLDEWAGIIAAGAIRVSSLGCLRALIKRAHEGSFTPERALQVAQARKVRRRVASAQARLLAQEPEIGPIDEDNALARRLDGIAKRVSNK